MGKNVYQKQPDGHLDPHDPAMRAVALSLHLGYSSMGESLVDDLECQMFNGVDAHAAF